MTKAARPVSIESTLQRLPVRLRAVFAACCAERLLPAYRHYCARCGIAPTLVDRLALVWSVVLGLRAASATEVRNLFEEDTRTLVPPEARGNEYAQDAAISVLYALLSLAPETDVDTEGPVSAARHVTDALDRYVARLTEIQPDDPSYAERVTNHTLLRQEVERQKRDLDDLSRLVHREDEWGNVIAAIRDRAVRERLECLVVSALDTAMAGLFAFLKDREFDVPSIEVRVVELPIGLACDERGRPRVRRADFSELQGYRSRFDELLAKGLPWLNMTCCGLDEGRMVVAIEFPVGGSRPSARTSINYSGPTEVAYLRGWDVSEVIAIE